MKSQYKKDIVRCFLILVIGLISALFIYPFIHELGHVVASVCVGADVLDFTLFPLPSVLCNVGAVDNAGKILISFGGVALPIFIAEITPRKWFCTWYIRVLLKSISLISFVISVVSLTANCNTHDDMVKALEYWIWGKSLLIFMLCSVATCIIISIVREKPISRICKYFKI